MEWLHTQEVDCRKYLLWCKRRIDDGKDSANAAYCKEKLGILDCIPSQHDHAVSRPDSMRKQILCYPQAIDV